MPVFTNKQQRVDALRETAIFGAMPKKELAALDRHVTGVTLDAGTEMARQDRAPQQMFLIVNGTATVRRNKRKIATLGPGDTVGELSLLDGGKQSATVTADTECQALVVPVNEFKAMLEESPTFAHNLLKSLATRLRNADNHIVG